MFDLRNRRVYHNELYDIYVSRKQRAKCGPAADRLSCRISTKMDSQPCGGTIPNKPPQCVYSQLAKTLHRKLSHENTFSFLLISSSNGICVFYVYIWMLTRVNINIRDTDSIGTILFQAHVHKV